MSQKRPRSTDEINNERVVLARFEEDVDNNEDEEIEEVIENNERVIKEMLDRVANSIPLIAQKPDNETRINQLISVLNMTLKHIHLNPVSSYDLYAEDDIARCVFNLLTQMIDHELVKHTHPEAHASLQQNATLLERFFKVTNPAYREFNPIIIIYLLRPNYSPRLFSHAVLDSTETETRAPSPV